MKDNPNIVSVTYDKSKYRMVSIDQFVAPSALSGGCSDIEVTNEVFDAGPWWAGENQSDGRVFIESHDFHHDVRLYIDGDFESKEQKQQYALGLAKAMSSVLVYKPVQKQKE